ncbi:MAG: ATPase P [Treponema sp.]|jgi:copper chaperone CopZ|nr:ATPase P [Treponema sp.]
MIVSYIPGRIRLRFKELRDPLIGNIVSSRIKEIPGITKVEIKPVTGSILIEFDAAVLPPEKLLETGKKELARFNISLDMPDLPGME